MLSALVLGLGCTPAGVVGVEERADASSAGDGPGGLTADAAMRDAADAVATSRAAFCEGAGPLVPVGDGLVVAERSCGGRVATRTFRYGICVCGDAVIEDALAVDAFDAREGPFSSGRPGGSVGVNGRYVGAAEVAVAGSLILNEGGLLSLSTAHAVGFDLRTRGPLFVDDEVSVGRDLVVGGDVSVSGSLRVGRDLVAPATATLSEGVELAGERRTDVESAAPPCDCSVAGRVDVAALVRGGLASADNAELGVSRTLLVNPLEPLEIALPCGRFAFDAITISDAPVRLRVDGRTALFVAGDALFEDDFTVELGPEGELDVFVAGTLTSTAELRLGSPERPSGVRVYVGGAAPVELAASTVIGGNLYAPDAELRPSDRVEIFGAVFVDALHSTGELVVHYDASVLAAGDTCPRPEGIACAGCGDCPGGAACVAGLCEPCESDQACCAPLFCSAGRCLAAPF